MITGASRWYLVGNNLVASVRNGLSSKPKRASMVPGEIVWDSCDCGGMLAVTLSRLYLSENFPEESETVTGACQPPYEVGQFTVAVVRCAPQPAGAEAAPPVDELDAAAGLLLQDATEMLDAVTATLCRLRNDDQVLDYFVTPVEPVGPEGGCVGVNLTVRVCLVRS
ncbi:hypothetical protein [Streptomyces sp. NRRL S-455]|uniref:hypothetical protein n=1 Tax=Streptomyces sp. NRRL S-455 TaxID=1463908 RepID=UPI00068D00C1|nr:hypothetical protein [Streptomyces sp. NRRL S-455]